MTTDKIQNAAEEIERHMNEIHQLFKPGVKLTFISRVPGNIEADMILTIDELDEIAKVIERSRGRPVQ